MLSHELLTFVHCWIFRKRSLCTLFVTILYWVSDLIYQDSNYDYINLHFVLSDIKNIVTLLCIKIRHFTFMPIFSSTNTQTLLLAVRFEFPYFVVTSWMSLLRTHGRFSDQFIIKLKMDVTNLLFRSWEHCWFVVNPHS